MGARVAACQASTMQCTHQRGRISTVSQKRRDGAANGVQSTTEGTTDGSARDFQLLHTLATYLAATGHQEPAVSAFCVRQNSVTGAAVGRPHRLSANAVHATYRKKK